MRKNPRIFLYHILTSIEEIERNTKNIDEIAFMQNVTVQDAVIRRLEIIGEASRNLPKSYREKHPEVEWRKISGLRDVIVHEYFGLSLKLIWRIVQKNIPELKEQMKLHGFTPVVSERTEGAKSFRSRSIHP